ncbi:MAG: hypothetical protein JWM78_1627 [Verrucomicrobiaceae bacterium]|nr:hypothetical protein [Verrucomicrobiaceae bacterium]
MRPTHDTFTTKIGDAIVQLPARAVVHDYLRRFLDRPEIATSAIPKIGAHWPEQGGVYAGAMRGENGVPDYHLIVPTNAAAAVAEIKWGGRGKDIDGAKSDFDGLANTTSLCESKHDHPAAEWAANLTIDGLNDFYLPSRRELRLCWVNVPELFETGWHWTSTQYSADNAWCQGFDDGFQGSNCKDDEFRARAVRRFVSHSVI